MAVAVGCMVPEEDRVRGLEKLGAILLSQRQRRSQLLASAVANGSDR
ncbi:hypothetical protein [[Phormidium ambiguum] IAM M-71]|nr:hypothetical protein [Phormidium ambiguum]